MNGVRDRSPCERRDQNGSPLFSRTLNDFSVDGHTFDVRCGPFNEYPDLSEPGLKRTFGRRDLQVQVINCRITREMQAHEVAMLIRQRVSVVQVKVASAVLSRINA